MSKIKSSSDSNVSPLRRLARRAGIELEYENARGAQVTIPDDVLHSLLSAMGLKATTDADALAHLEQMDQSDAAHMLPSTTVVRSDRQPARIRLNLRGRERVSWLLTLEDGRTEHGEIAVSETSPAASSARINARFERGCLLFEDQLPEGYHTLRVGDQSAHVIVAPPRCWLPPELEGGGRIWGVASQLYLLRSKRNWGVGDFTDLHELIVMAARWGGDVVGLNPLHAMFLDAPEHASPYSPASRLFLNVLNIDVEAIPEVRSEADAIDGVELRGAIERARAAELVDYETAAVLKLDRLRAAFRCFQRSAQEVRLESFARFRRDRGESLLRFCIFQALRLREAARDPAMADWRRWPEALRDPSSAEVARFAAESADEIGFLAWTQWIANEQLEKCAESARSGGMMVGLYRDLAVGADLSGAETWSNPAVVVAAAHAGAPPDIFNPAGQDWGLPPFSPAALREEGFASFIELVRANMRHAGALRIDHVLGLRHLYWIAEGMSPSQGAYVAYPFDELAGILALESRRNRCLVVGEDLGTIPAGFRDRLAEAGILSCRVLYFEQDKTQKFLPPEAYPALALASVGSHDLPTLDGWWNGSDIEIRERNNLYPDPDEARRQRERRAQGKRQLLVALRQAGLDSGDGSDPMRRAVAAHSFLARSGAAIAIVALDDLVGETAQVNVPATTDEYPNWRRRLSVPLEEVETNQRARAIIEAVAHERPRGAAQTEPA